MAEIIEDIVIDKLPGMTMTVKVRLSKRFVWRMKLALLLIIIAGRIIPCELVYKKEEDA